MRDRLKSPRLTLFNIGTKVTFAVAETAESKFSEALHYCRLTQLLIHA